MNKYQWLLKNFSRAELVTILEDVGQQIPEQWSTQWIRQRCVEEIIFHVFFYKNWLSHRRFAERLAKDLYQHLELDMKDFLKIASFCAEAMHFDQSADKALDHYLWVKNHAPSTLPLVHQASLFGEGARAEKPREFDAGFYVFMFLSYQRSLFFSEKILRLFFELCVDWEVNRLRGESMEVRLDDQQRTIAEVFGVQLNDKRRPFDLTMQALLAEADVNGLKHSGLCADGQQSLALPKIYSKLLEN